METNAGKFTKIIGEMTLLSAYKLSFSVCLCVLVGETGGSLWTALMFFFD